MTQQDAMGCIDRYVRAGYAAPRDFEGAFEEWVLAFGSADVDDVTEAITRMVRVRTSNFWPTPGELSEHLRAVYAGRTADGVKCDSCHGAGWVESTPFLANGGLVYTGVVRCGRCGIPAPRLDHLEGRQRPMSASDLRAYLEARQPSSSAPMNRGEFLAAIHAMVERMTMGRGR